MFLKTINWRAIFFGNTSISSENQTKELKTLIDLPTENIRSSSKMKIKLVESHLKQIAKRVYEGNQVEHPISHDHLNKVFQAIVDVVFVENPRGAEIYNDLWEYMREVKRRREFNAVDEVVLK